MSKPPKIENFPQSLKKGIGILGTSSWLFGISGTRSACRRLIAVWLLWLMAIFPL